VKRQLVVSPPVAHQKCSDFTVPDSPLNRTEPRSGSGGPFELGLIPDGKPSLEGPLTYWGVVDAAAEEKRLEGLGAKVIEPAHEVGGGIFVASVADPFGNSFGLIQNPHFSIEKK
jgi:hypothetical protein